MNFRVLCHREFPKLENFVLKIVQEILILEINSSLALKDNHEFSWLISPNVLDFRPSTWDINNVLSAENQACAPLKLINFQSKNFKNIPDGCLYKLE